MFTAPFGMAAVGLVLGALIGFVIARSRAASRQELEKKRGQDEASRLLKRAEKEAENARKAGELAGREEGFRLRDAWETEETRRREEIERAERRAEERSDALDRQVERTSAREEEAPAIRRREPGNGAVRAYRERHSGRSGRGLNRPRPGRWQLAYHFSRNLF